jgi:hypothetical protein
MGDLNYRMKTDAASMITRIAAAATRAKGILKDRTTLVFLFPFSRWPYLSSPLFVFRWLIPFFSQGGNIGGPG